jgi:hypothetical protein
MRTTSGAYVQVVGDRAVKYGFGDVGARVREQADYCRRLGEIVAPRVLWSFRGGYVMERLTNLSRFHNRIDGEVLTWMIFDKLENEVWRKDRAMPTVNDWRLHEDYIVQRCHEYAPWAQEAVLNLFIDAQPWFSRPCLTHGDPTWENVMGDDKTGDLVLIDPLPPKDEIPEVKEVDVGKILQSLYGYEDVKAGRLPKKRLGCLPSAYRTPAAWYWAAAHFVRLLPYQSDFAVRNQCELLLQEVLTDARRL